MSTFYEKEHLCSLCGQKSMQQEISSTSQFGTMDLDMRPPEMIRFTMWCWVQECPHCGYVARRLEDPPTVSREWLREEPLVNCDGIRFNSELAILFYKLYLIYVHNNDCNKAFSAAHEAAWACDDNDEKRNAILCRKKALIELDKILAEEFNEDLSVVRADLLRRSRQFDVLLKEYSRKTYRKELLNQIIAFQIDLAKKKDAKCYKVSDIVKTGQE